MKHEDVVTIREEPELDPEELFRRFVLDKVASAVFLAMSEGDINITADNITPLLSLLNINTGDEAVIDLVRDACINTGGVINTEAFGEIVLKNVFPSEEVAEETLKEAFSIVDVDGDGIITGADIYRLMMGVGKVITDDEILHMLKAVDSDGDGRATFEDFNNFILGLGPFLPEDPVTPEDKSTEDKESNDTDGSQPKQAPVVCEPLPEHMKRRSLFSYGDMIAKQLAVISNMKRLMKAAENVEGCRETEAEGIGVHKETVDRDVDQETREKQSDGDITVNDNKSKLTDIPATATKQVTITGKCETSLYSSANHWSSLDNCGTSVTTYTNTQSETRRQSVTFNPNNDSSSGILTNSEKREATSEIDEMTEADLKQSDIASVPMSKMRPSSNYSKKSPYYGRIRPEVFCMNPLPPLVPDKPEEDTESCTDTESDVTSSSDVSVYKQVVLVDRAQQTTEEFHEDMAEYGQVVSVNPNNADDKEQIVETWERKNSSRRDSSTLTEIHGIPVRLKKAKGLEKAILKRRNASFDIFRCQSEESEKHKFPAVPLLRRTSSRRNLLAERHSSPLEPKSHQLGSLTNRLTFSQDESSYGKCSLPARPQTARPGLNQYDDKARVQPLFVDHKFFSASLEEGSSVKRVGVVDLSDNINRESVYTPEIVRSRHHHGFRSIRPLARVIMAFQSSANNAKVSASGVSSLSRVLEETGAPYIRTNIGSEKKPICVKPSSKTKLLNIELPVEKVFRPVLKRRSTLSRISFDNVRQHVPVV